MAIGNPEDEYVDIPLKKSRMNTGPGKQYIPPPKSEPAGTYGQVMRDRQTSKENLKKLGMQPDYLMTEPKEKTLSQEYQDPTYVRPEILDQTNQLGGITSVLGGAALAGASATPFVGGYRVANQLPRAADIMDINTQHLESIKDAPNRPGYRKAPLTGFEKLSPSRQLQQWRTPDFSEALKNYTGDAKKNYALNYRDTKLIQPYMDQLQDLDDNFNKKRLSDVLLSGNEEEALKGKYKLARNQILIDMEDARRQFMSDMVNRGDVGFIERDVAEMKNLDNTQADTKVTEGKTAPRKERRLLGGAADDVADATRAESRLGDAVKGSVDKIEEVTGTQTKPKGPKPFEDILKRTLGSDWDNIGKLRKLARGAGPIAAAAGAALDAYGGWSDYADEGLGMQTSGASKGLLSGATFGAPEGIINSMVKADEGDVGMDIARKAGNIPARVINQLADWGTDLYNWGTDGNREYRPYLPTMGTSEEGKGNQNGVEIEDTYFGDWVGGTAVGDFFGHDGPTKKQEPTTPQTAQKNADQQVDAKAREQLGMKPRQETGQAGKPMPTLKRPGQAIAGVTPEATSVEGVSQYNFEPGSTGAEEYGNTLLTNVGADGKTFSSMSEADITPPFIQYVKAQYGDLAGSIPVENLMNEYQQYQQGILAAGTAQQKRNSEIEQQSYAMLQDLNSGDAGKSRAAFSMIIPGVKNREPQSLDMAARYLNTRLNQNANQSWTNGPMDAINSAYDPANPMGLNFADMQITNKDSTLWQKVIKDPQGNKSIYDLLSDYEKELFHELRRAHSGQ